MVLSQTSEYALRAMSQLAVLPADQAVRAKDLAQLTDIPLAYLSKIMRMLVQGGLLEAVPGHGGGFTLARPPSEVRFADILEAVGERPETNRCAFGWGKCNPRHPCLLHPVVAGLNEAVSRWAETTNLGMIGVDHAALRHHAVRLAEARQAAAKPR